MLAWVQATEGGVNITGDLMKEKGTQLFAELYPDMSPFGFSNGWLDRFKKRHGILSRKPIEQNRELKEPPLLVMCDQMSGEPPLALLEPKEEKEGEGKVSHEEAAKMLDMIEQYWVQQPNNNTAFGAVIQDMREQIALASGNISVDIEEPVVLNLMEHE